MPFKYNPPTRFSCGVCNELLKSRDLPIVDSYSGRSSSSEDYPIHNWFYFVLGYSPRFPEYILNSEKINSEKIILDPFMGTGTTLVTCKQKGINSFGIDANDFFVEVADTKLDWEIEFDEFKENIDNFLESLIFHFEKIDFSQNSSYVRETLSLRPLNLSWRYISDIPFAKLFFIKKFINEFGFSEKIFKKIKLCLNSIIVPSSNIRYGPGFGVGKIKGDEDVLGLFKKKILRMGLDIKNLENKSRSCNSEVSLFDSRKLDDLYDKNSIDYLITSPPYPGDHEYTKHTRLELMFNEIANSVQEFRVIKKRMIRGSTTNIYKEDFDRKFVKDFESIKLITDLIDKRLKEDNATSGFEKLYVKLVWEYFGGMSIHFQKTLKVLKPRGKYFLLVGDSHAFKMVHIQTAKILSEIALSIGYSGAEIILWQNKFSSSHKYLLREDILVLTK